MAIGRPKEHDRDKIAKNLLEWAEEETSLNLNKFCAINKLPPSKLSLFAKENDEFRQSYELAKAFLAVRREEYLTDGMLHVKAYDISVAAYDYFVKEECRDQTQFEASIKKQNDINVSDDIKEMFEDTMTQLSSLQSERKIADSNINNEI